MATTTAHISCKRCGRPLTSLRSTREALRNGGYGRGCARKIEEKAAVLATAEHIAPAQIAKAIQLVEDGGVQRVIGSLYLAVSSDGATRYEVDTVAHTCTCPAGQHGRRCYHSLSAALLAA